MLAYCIMICNGKMTVRIFVGVALSTEIEIKLNQSKLWKEASFHPSCESLMKVHFQGKDYLGRYLAYNEVTVKDLKEAEKQMLDTLHKYSSEINIDKIESFTFPQVLVP